MNNCKYCGNPLPDGTDFCSVCGAMAQKSQATDAKVYGKATVQKKNSLSIGYLIWSAANILLSASFFYFLTPIASLVMSIIALIQTIRARDCTDTERKSRLRTAKILNIIATAVTILSVVLCIIAIIVIFISSDSLGDFLRYYYYYGIMD